MPCVYKEWLVRRLMDYFIRKDFLDYMSKQLTDVLKLHEATGTLIDGKNLFLLNTGGISYKVIIERGVNKNVKMDTRGRN